MRKLLVAITALACLGTIGTDALFIVEQSAGTAAPAQCDMAWRVTAPVFYRATPNGPLIQAITHGVIEVRCAQVRSIESHARPGTTWRVTRD